MLPAFRMAALPQPRPTSSIRTATKVNSPVPSMRRPVLPCCWHGVCGWWATGRKDGASFAEGNCAGAKRCAFVIGWFFFSPPPFPPSSSSSLPSALLKPCLDLFTQWMQLLWQGGGCSSDKHKHVSSGQQRPLTFTGYLPTDRPLVTRPGTKKHDTRYSRDPLILSKRKSENYYFHSSCLVLWLMSLFPQTILFHMKNAIPQAAIRQNISRKFH